MINVIDFCLEIRYNKSRERQSLILTGAVRCELVENDKYVKRSVKDSVFTDLFKDKNNIVLLYSALHPEEKITADEIHNVTLKNILTDNLYNDLGFTVGDKIIVLAEAQSTWSDNILIRTLMYLAQSYQDHIERTGQNIYGSKKVTIPMPELYVIYTGDDKIERPEMTMTDMFFGGQETALNLTVKVIQHSDVNNIINQYITFCKISSEVMRRMGRTPEAVNEIFRICCDRDILKEYLITREREVYNIMFALFDDEYIMRCTLRSARSEGKTEGKAEGKIEGLIETCRDLGETEEATVNRVKIKFNISEEEARVIVKKYWNCTA